ncbi:MAG TPA: glutathione S-transferase family protein [Beijerinckiaceae bacterium]|nr:glutathione S-transferase family protein [Beijerinckiaceae bacterium]
MSGPHIFWGWHLSYYAGKLRCYLAWKGIPFEDRAVDFVTLAFRIKRRFGAPVMPVVVTPEGEWLQDSSAIIDLFEARFPDRPVVPEAPVQRFAACLLETWADEWWIPVAMHTRWSYPENYALFEKDAGDALLPMLPRFMKRMAVARVARLLRSYLPRVGITADQVPVLDAWTRESLEALDQHFAQFPYLLGGRPTLADFGLAGPMYGHLGRDPWPKRELVAQRPHLRAWIDRMASPPAGDAGALAADDAIPATLEPILKAIVSEFLPMIEAILGEVDAFLQVKPGGARLPRSLGAVSFPMGSGRYSRAAMPFALWKMQRLLSLYRALPGEGQSRVRRWLAGLGGERLLDLPIPRLQREGLLVSIQADARVDRS